MMQVSISDDDLSALKIGRRQLSTEWPDTVKPRSLRENFCLLLPFTQTYKNAFESMYEGEYPYHARNAAGGRLQVFINETELEEELPEKVQHWVSTVGKYVAIQDLLAVSFAIDYTHVAGNPDKPRSSIAELRGQAKPYDTAATDAHKKAAKELAKASVKFLNEMTCYDGADCVVAIPPSDPEKLYSLPKILASAIAEAREIPDFSEFVSTTVKRASIKNVTVDKKISTLRGTIKVKPKVFEGMTVLLIDDLYQSGATMNCCAQLLLEAGAECILGLACEKTCRNDDNV